jgi:outer membrane protein OmpA-like peptidoglycan-associated protein
MPDIEDMTPGQVLAEASVADFIKSLGLSIAEAQKALDENSVNQMGEFITPRDGLGGKSLLDIGLMPAFYHYQHADITCSMQLSLRVEKNIGVGVNIGGSFSDTTSSESTSSSSESSSESGSSEVSRERTAQVEVQSDSTGALSIGGRSFALTGSDPLSRMRALRDAVTADSSAGVPRLLFEPATSTFTITTDAPPEKVQTTSNTVTFLGGGFDRAVIQVDTDVATDYVFNGTTTVSTTAQGSVSAYATHVAEQVNAAGISASALAPSEPISRFYFDTGEDEIFTASGEAATRNRDLTQRLIDLSQLIIRQNLNVTIQGYADAQPYRDGSRPSDDSNRDLGQRRGLHLQRLLLAHGVPAARINVVQSTGAADAQADVAAGGPVDNVRFRRTDVNVAGRTAYYLVCDAPSGTDITAVSPDKLTPPPGTGNGFIYLYRPQPLSLSGNSCTIDGTNFPFSGAAVSSGPASGTPEAYAQNLMTAINGNSSVAFTSSATGNVVTVFQKSQPFRLTLYSTQSRNIEMSGTEGVRITREFTRSSSSSGTRENTGNRTVAIGASVDVRYGRQFEMNVTGNSSISARLVSIPAPPQFLETIKDFLDQGGGD